MVATAALVISKVVIRRFRCIADLELNIDPATTVLVGENNVGKTTVLTAMAVALGRRRASTDDLRRAADGRIAPDAVIDVFFSPPPSASTFNDDIAQRLLAVQRDPLTAREIVGVRLTLRGSGEGALLVESRTFLQPVGGQWVESPVPAFSSRVLDLVDSHLMDASRDLLNEMDSQTSAWGRVLSDLKIPDLPDGADAQPHPLGQRGLERDLEEISKRVRQASPVLSQLHSDLSVMKDTQSTVGGVDLVPLPLRLEELGRTIEVVLHQRDSVGLPLRFHGAGSRSLAALFVFRTMCTLKVGADQGMRPHLVTLLEEPEAHLHPQAVSALVSVIDSIPGQRIVSSHSPTLVAEVPASAIRLFRRKGGEVEASQLGPKKPRKLEQFRRFFGRPFGELFFARLVVFGDGVSEKNALPVLVSMDLKTQAAAHGISFVDCKSMSNYSEVNPVLEALHDLGIPWLILCDNDQAGIEALSKLKDPGDGQSLTQSHDAVVVLSGTKQIEQILIDGGFGSEISAIAAELGTPATNDDARLQFLKSQKGWVAEAVALRARAAGKPAPTVLRPLFERIRVRLGEGTPAVAAIS